MCTSKPASQAPRRSKGKREMTIRLLPSLYTLTPPIKHYSIYYAINMYKYDLHYQTILAIYSIQLSGRPVVQ